MTIKAEQVARALVAEARKAGVDPLRVFEPDNRFVRVRVARSRPGWSRVLGVAVSAAA